jgi:RNA polymerase sigma-70 factor, ECF subfamily
MLDESVRSKTPYPFEWCMEMTIPSDGSLMQSVAAGDLAAFEQLVVRHQQAAWRTAYSLLGDRQAAEDVAQEAFLRIFQSADRYRPVAAFRTYLYRIVVRLCLDVLAKKRPIPSEACGQVVAPSAPADGQLVGDERAEEIWLAVSSLPSKQRLAVVLRYYQGLSYREVAAVMRTTVKGIERLLARGRTALQRQLRNLLDE